MEVARATAARTEHGQYRVPLDSRAVTVKPAVHAEADDVCVRGDVRACTWLVYLETKAVEDELVRVEGRTRRRLRRSRKMRDCYRSLAY